MKPRWLVVFARQHDLQEKLNALPQNSEWWYSVRFVMPSMYPDTSILYTIIAELEEL